MLFGGDINTYSVARAFYERYKVKSYTFGKFATGPSYQSRIIEYTPNPKIDTDEVFMKTVKSFCSKHADKTVVLVGCGDSYVALISKHKNELPKNTIAPYIDFDLMNSLQQKETFYKLCVPGDDKPLDGYAGQHAQHGQTDTGCHTDLHTAVHHFDRDGAVCDGLHLMVQHLNGRLCPPYGGSWRHWS